MQYQHKGFAHLFLACSPNTKLMLMAWPRYNVRPRNNGVVESAYQMPTTPIHGYFYCKISMVTQALISGVPSGNKYAR